MARSSLFDKWLHLILLSALILVTAEEPKTSIPERIIQWRSRLERETPDTGIGMIVASAICFLAAAVSSAGGVGGGSLFLPILNLFAGIDLKRASKFSAFMVAGTAISNVLYNVFSDSQHIIDYDIALLSMPCMLLGVTIGVICNVAFPEWLVTLLFAVVLSLSTVKTCRTGARRWMEESKEMREKRTEKEENVEEEVKELARPLIGEEREEDSWKTEVKKISVLVTVWFCFFVLQFLRQGRGVKGLINVERCSVGYWLITSSQIPVALLFTTYILYVKHQEQGSCSRRENSKKAIDNLPKVIFPISALMAGVLGGLFGIGGGLLMNPVLLQIGVPPQTTAATSCFMVLFSSSMSAVQYLMMGMNDIRQALIMAVGCGISSMVGVILVEKAIRMYGRASLVIFSLGTVMVLSSISITGFGLIDVWMDYVHGRNLGFKLPC